jgi:HEAT repeat protein
MRVRTWLAALVCLLAAVGCGKEKSTDELVEDMKSSKESDRIAAVRTLPRRKGEAAKVVPTLIEALKDKSPEIRHDAALGLGSYHEEARDAVPALQALLKDRDRRVREAAGITLSRIDPVNFPDRSRPQAAP